MDRTAHGWNIFDARTPVLTHEYSFGPGTSTSLAVGGAQGLFIASPPLHPAAGVVDDLARYGDVRALIASNAFHYLGIPEWKARFPAAAVYAPAQSIARVAKRTGITDIRPLSDAAAIAGPRLELVDMPHYKTGEVLVRITTDRGLVWYVTDVIFNMPKLPANPIAAFMFRVARSAPGLKFNNIAPIFMVRDKAALRRWLAAEAAKAPPQWLIPAHGDIVDWSTRPDEARRFFAPN
jgi:glyoxylase-like metal-dependent hydrolase (beta-lactamase superfamily II)